MAVVTSYSFDEGTTFYIPSGANDNTLFDIDLTSLSNGGFAGVGFHSYHGHTDGAVYDASLTGIGTLSVVNYGASPTAITQIDNTNLVNTVISGGDVDFAIVNTSGGSVVGSTGLGFGSTQTADVAGLKGSGAGFVVALDHVFSSTDHDIYAVMRNANGSANGGNIAVETTAGTLDDKPSVAALNDGGFAIAWTRTDGGGNTSIRYAVYNDDGSVRLAATEADSNGTINRDVSVVALADGGFGLVYEDNSDGNSNISFAKYAGGGGFVSRISASTGSTPDSDAHATLLSNGFVAVTFSQDFGTDHDVTLQVLNPTAMALVGSQHTMDTTLLDNSVESAVASMQHGTMAVSWQEDGIGNQTQGITFVRTTTGDRQSNTILGDDLIDHMDGGKRNDDLFGVGGDDTLAGGRGKDVLTGGAGADSLDGGVGKNTASYAGSLGVIADLMTPGSNTGEAAGDTYTMIQNLIGSAFNDVLGGDANNNTLEGGGMSDTLFGRNGKDLLKGISGDDTLVGGAGADRLDGGSGSDTHAFLGASDSTGPNYDTIVGFNGNLDKIGVGFLVGAVDADVTSGTLNTTGFNASLAAAIGAGQLGAHHAVLFTPDAGVLAGHTFLIVDVNNSAGYQANQDLVLDMVDGSHLDNLDVTDFVALAGIDPRWIDPIDSGADTRHSVADHHIASSVIDHFMEQLVRGLSPVSDHFGLGHGLF